MRCRNRSGEEIAAFDGQGSVIAFLYDRPLGRGLLRVLIRPWVSRAAGWLLNRRISRGMIAPFVRKNHIDLTEYEGAPYRSYNAFFCRRIKPGRRPIDPDPDHLIAPCDAKLSAYPIAPDAHFQIKGVDYTMESLLRDASTAEKYRGGMLLLFRLTVDDYHHYCYPADGRVGTPVRIPGVYHTVNPHAAGRRAIYRENTRDYTVLSTERFGDVLMMEVGAMMVGRIVNLPGCTNAVRGAEKGWFEFGGSTVLLCLEPGVLTPDDDLLRNTADGFETVVRMGERVGKSGCVRIEQPVVESAGAGV